MKDIVWLNENKINRELVRELEELWNVKFPDAYVSIILDYDGGHLYMRDEEGKLRPGLIDAKIVGEIGFCLLKLSADNGVNHSDIISARKSFIETIPEPDKIFPFAESGGGDMIYFDYRKSADHPSILYQDHEFAISKDDLADYQLEERPLAEWLNDSLKPIADSFEELMDRCYPSNW